MTVRIDEKHFSQNSSASELLVRAMKEANDDAVVRLTTKHFRIYTEGLGHITQMDNPTRDECFKLWYDYHLAKAQKLKSLYEQRSVPFEHYENILIHRLRQARSHGAILQKMRG